MAFNSFFHFSPFFFMKKLLYLALLALGLATTTGCNDICDRIQDSPSFDGELVAPTPYVDTDGYIGRH
jgi:hypothetical protein